MLIRPFFLSTAIMLPASTIANAGPIFKHIVIVFQENRTPDNLFGSNPNFEAGVDIATSGITSKGVTVPLAPVPLAGCYDMDHTHQTFEFALNQGFDAEPVVANLCAKPLPPYPPFVYADNATGVMEPYFDIARGYGFANRMFQTNQGPSFPAHQFIFAGTSSPLPTGDLFAAENMEFHAPMAKGNQVGCLAPAGQTVELIDASGSEDHHRPIYPCFEHRTLSDLLDAASPPLSWRYYGAPAGGLWTAPNAIRHICQAKTVNGVPTCTGAGWASHVVSGNPSQVLTDIANCSLPAVTWLIPAVEESDHAAGNTGLGPQWVASIVNAIGTQNCPSGENYWNDTAILITWDDWGGWYDHVKPPMSGANQTRWGSGYTYGFRVPLLAVSAFTSAGMVVNAPLDFGSILYFVEQNFGLGFIGPDTGTFSHYADWQSSRLPFGKVSWFFDLGSPRPFVKIPAAMTPADFIALKGSGAAPDND